MTSMRPEAVSESMRPKAAHTLQPGKESLCSNDMTPGHPPKSGLWLVAFILLFLGGMICAGIYFFWRPYDLAWRAHLALSTMITVLAVGISLICASAQWWMHR